MPSWRNPNLSITLNDYNFFSQGQITKMDVYQFGVFRGDSVGEIIKILHKLEFYPKTFWGFDTFAGMPKETEEPIFQDSWDPDKEPDTFNPCSYEDFPFLTPAAAAQGLSMEFQKLVDDLKEKIVIRKDPKEQPPYHRTEVKMIAGLVEEHLSEDIGHDMAPAFYLDLDLDIYSPTKHVLKYFMENNLIIPGTIVGYDDWGGTPDWETMKYGESRAHREILEEFPNLKMKEIMQIGNAFPHVQKLFIVTDV